MQGNEMKTDPELRAKTIAELAVRCELPDQFNRFDRGVRASLSVSKEAVLKEEARLKRARAKKRAMKVS
jgi:hypothetical protein